MCVALVTARSLWFRQVQHSSHRFALALRRPVFSRRGGRFAHRAESPLPGGSNRLEIVRRRLPKEARNPMSQLKASRTSPIVRAKPSSRPAEPQNPRGDRPSGNCCPWPKAWQNLRSTRETELVELHGIKSAVECIGNSEAVARKHYLQTTESDFLRAIRTDVGSDAKSDAMTVSQSLEAARTEPKPKTSEKPLVLQGESKRCDSVPVTQVPRAGLEPALAAF